MKYITKLLTMRATESGLHENSLCGDLLVGETAGGAAIALSSLPSIAHTASSARGSISVAEFAGISTIALTIALESKAHTRCTVASARREVGVSISLSVGELAGITTIAVTLVAELEAHAGRLAGTTGSSAETSLSVAETAGVTIGALTLLESEAHAGSTAAGGRGVTSLVSELALLTTVALASLEGIAHTGGTGSGLLAGEVVGELAGSTAIAVSLLVCVTNS